MQPEDDPRPAAGEPTSAAVERRFSAIVRALLREDRVFARRFAVPTRGLRAGNLMVVVGLVATVALGFVPLAVGVHLQALGLLVLGAVACVVMPVLAPLTTRLALGHFRPLRVCP